LAVAGRRLGADCHTSSSQQFGVVAETAEAGRVAISHRGEERVHEFDVEVVQGAVVDRCSIKVRWAASREETLLLEVGQGVVAVVCAQVCGACSGDATRLG